MFQKLSKSIHYRNNFENSKITSLLNLCLRKCVTQNFSQCLQRVNANSIIIQCEFDKYSILLIIWIEFISNFKMNFRLYILFNECICYQNAKSLTSQSNCEMSIFAILSNSNLILKFCMKFFWKNSRTNLFNLIKYATFIKRFNVSLINDNEILFLIVIAFKFR